MMAIRRTRGLRADLCVLHGHVCVWAGGDQYPMREMYEELRTAFAKTDKLIMQCSYEEWLAETTRIGHGCRAATREDQVRHVGIFQTAADLRRQVEREAEWSKAWRDALAELDTTGVLKYREGM